MGGQKGGSWRGGGGGGGEVQQASSKGITSRKIFRQNLCNCEPSDFFSDIPCQLDPPSR